MSRPQKPWLDWRRERDALSGPLSCPGGVVRVQTSLSGPLMEFANALRSYLDKGEWTNPWKTIQFDPDNSDTRYFGEMTRQIERSISLPPDVGLPISLGQGSKVGSDISASEIKITNSFNFGSGEYEQAVVHERRSYRIVQVLRERVAHESFCFFFMNSDRFRRQDLASFRDFLWLAGLAELTSRGVLLVDLSSFNPRTDIEWPPSPSVRITLADDYDAQTREHAIADLSEFLIASGFEKTQSDARAYSRAMLDNHKGPTTLYAQLAAITAARSSEI